MGPDEPQNTPPPVEPEQQPSAPSPVEPVEVPAETPAVEQQENAPVADASFPEQQTSQLPVKKSKKGLIIGLVVAGVVILGLASSALVYALVYNNPDNAVTDAFSKIFTAKSSSVTGTAMIKTQDSSVKMDLSSASNQSGQASVDASVVVTVSGKDYTLKSHIVGTKDEVYVKLDDLRSVITGALGADYSAVIDQYYGSLLDKIDGKWVVIKQSDIDSLSSGTVSNKESQCVHDEIGKLQSVATLRNELMDVYKKNPLFTVASKGSDSDGNHYSLTPVSNDKAKSFLSAMTGTKFFTAVDNCVSTDLKKEFTDNVSSPSSTADTATGTLDVWVDGWSHNLKKISLNIKDSSTELTSEFKTTFNNNPAVTIPKGETTVDDLKSEIQKIQDQLTASVESSYSMSDYSY
jgi:phosphotransferase system IIB component